MRVFLTMLAVASLTASTLASAADFTGTYVGFANCKITDNNGAKLREKIPVTLEASQPETAANRALLNVLINGTSFFGDVIFDPKKPDQKGIGTLNDCTHIIDPEAFIYEMWHFKGKVKPGDDKGSLNFTAIVDWSGVDGSLGVCKGRVKRVSRIDPGVGFCEIPAN